MIPHDCPKCGSSRIAWSQDSIDDRVVLSVWCLDCASGLCVFCTRETLEDAKVNLSKQWNGVIQ